NLNTLLDACREDDRLKTLTDRLAISAPLNLTLQGLTGTSTAIISGALWNNTDYNHVFILNDREEAAYFQNDLENILHALDIFYFPDSFKKAGFFDVMNGSHLMLRTEALMKFAGSSVHKKILVTYPEALFEKVIRPNEFSSAMIEVKAGTEIQLDDLLGKLVQAGFERSDFVYEPGQFAMRGGILDIYSFGNDKPYRIELSGNDIESIRIFDPETQLSERKLLQVTLIPNMKFKKEGQDKTSLFEFLPENTIWWITDKNFLIETIRSLEEKLQHFLDLSGKDVAIVRETLSDTEEEKSVALTVNDFITAASVSDWLKEKKVVQFNPSNEQQEETEKIEFHTTPQPVFNRRFDMLIEDLKKYKDQQYALFIFSDNPKQLARIQAIFDDLKSDIP
ncbi:MAG: transcription-repair coupling factor, partial [Chitinophagaceae bacterium]